MIFFLITKSNAWRLLNLIMQICQFLNSFLQRLFFFYQSVWLCYICIWILSRNHLAHFWVLTESNVFENIRTLNIFFSTKKKPCWTDLEGFLREVYYWEGIESPVWTISTKNLPLSLSPRNGWTSRNLISEWLIEEDNISTQQK